MLDKYAPRKKPLLSLRPTMKETELLDEAARRAALEKAGLLFQRAAVLCRLGQDFVPPFRGGGFRLFQFGGGGFRG